MAQQRGRYEQAAGAVHFHKGGPFHEFPLEELVAAVIPGEPGHLGVDLVPFRLGVDHQAPLEDVAVDHQTVVQHAVQLLPQEASHESTYTTGNGPQATDEAPAKPGTEKATAPDERAAVACARGGPRSWDTSGSAACVLVRRRCD